MASNFQPYKQSSAHHSLEALGARWKSLDRWHVPASFGSPEREMQAASSQVGLADLSYLGKVEFRGRELDSRLPRVLRIQQLPAVGRVCVFSSEEAGRLYRITHEQVLCTVSGSFLNRLLSVCEVGACLHGTERTSGLACFLVCGPCSVDVLSRVTSVDLRDHVFAHLSCARAPLAHVNSTIARRDLGTLRGYEIFVSREYGQYVWQVLWETGGQFGMTALGEEARQRLEKQINV